MKTAIVLLNLLVFSMAVSAQTVSPSSTPRMQPLASPPQWIDDAQFERQLRLVHGKVPDNENGLFGPDSMMWHVGQYITPTALGSGRALLLQISHPWITAGIDAHSSLRANPLKRGRKTFRYVLSIIYGTREQAMQTARELRNIHSHVEGQLPDHAGPFTKGSEYRANEVQAMVWVHATLWETLVITYEQSVGPLSAAEKERFYQETKLFAYMFGIPDDALPKDWSAFLKYCQEMRESGTLVITPASKRLAEYLFGWHGLLLYVPGKYATLAAAANLPPNLREGYGLKYGPFRRTFFKSTLAASRAAHKIVPRGLTQNPVHKEANARIRGKRASWWTRTQLKAAFGEKRLVNDR